MKYGSDTYDYGYKKIDWLITGWGLGVSLPSRHRKRSKFLNSLVTRHALRRTLKVLAQKPRPHKRSFHAYDRRIWRVSRI